MNMINDGLFSQMIDNLFRTSPKKVRGLGKSTLTLRAAILQALCGIDPPVTVRQVYYLAEKDGAVEKTEKGYNRVQRQVLAMRRDGTLPYDWIADLTRWRRKPRTYDSLTACLAETASFYRRAVWRDLDAYVEVWAEKDAIAGTLYPITQKYDVPLMVCRGYSSETFAYEAAEAIREIGKPAYIYYAGDLDPSGWHASRDLAAKLERFGADVRFQPLAVHPWQVEAWNLSTRATKLTDNRYKAFFKEFGQGYPSTEVDAIPPNTLKAIMRDAIERHVPKGTLEALELEESLARESLQQFRGEAARLGL